MTKETSLRKQAEASEQSSLFDAERWGLPKEAINSLADRLRDIWSRFRACFKTKTRDTSEYAFAYLRGLLTLDTKRNYANIARRVIDKTMVRTFNSLCRILPGLPELCSIRFKLR